MRRGAGAERKLNGAAAGGEPTSGSDDEQTGECYTLFMASSNWYLFLRLHHILCERLNKIYERAVIMASEEEQHKKLRTESTAIALRLKPKSEWERRWPARVVSKPQERLEPLTPDHSALWIQSTAIGRYLSAGLTLVKSVEQLFS